VDQPGSGCSPKSDLSPLYVGLRRWDNDRPSLLLLPLRKTCHTRDLQHFFDSMKEHPIVFSLRSRTDRESLPNRKLKTLSHCHNTLTCFVLPYLLPLAVGRGRSICTRDKLSRFQHFRGLGFRNIDRSPSHASGKLSFRPKDAAD